MNVNAKFKSLYGLLKVSIQELRCTWYNYSSKTTEENRYLPLTPVGGDVNEFYGHPATELKFALENGEDNLIRNIAVSGPYGAGKSTFIEQFQKTYKQFTFVNISLASFNSTEANEALSRNASLRDLVEVDIVQQLLFSKSSNAQSNSKIKRIAPLNKRDAQSRVFVFVSAALLLWSILDYGSSFKSEYIFEYIFSIDFDFYSRFLVPLITFSSISVKFLVYCAQQFSKFELKSISTKGVSIQKEEAETTFSRNLDEIIHFFSTSGLTAVVIEDLDRFKSVELFSDLRQLNKLVNAAPEVTRPIFFIYAVRDGLFEPSERTKFFDLIIPIIPIVNTHNAYEKLKHCIGMVIDREDKAVISRLDDSLLRAISSYVGELRVVNNIVNEFRAFFDVHEKHKAYDPNRLLAIISLKNLHPKYYDQLLEKKGPFFKAFEAYENSKKVNLDELRKRKEGLQSELKRAKEFGNLDVEAIRYQYLMEIVKNLGVK